RNACALGAAWFGDGTVPTETRVNGRSASLEQALTEAAGLLTGATHPLVYLAGDLSCETQREAVAIADRLHAALDSLAATAATAVLAAQRRGRAGATLGEIRQRADLVVFWAVDPSTRYPRYGRPGPGGGPRDARPGLELPNAVRLVHAPGRRQPLRRRCRTHVADRVPLRRGLRARVPQLPPASGRSRAARRGRGGRRACC